jgi:hypothetical protein
MTKPKLIYDSYCGWPYAEPYGMVPPPKVKRVRKRKPKKSGYASALKARPFVSCAIRECDP